MWYYNNGKNKSGPFNSLAIINMAKRGRISAKTLVSNTPKENGIPLFQSELAKRIFPKLRRKYFFKNSKATKLLRPFLLMFLIVFLYKAFFMYTSRNYLLALELQDASLMQLTVHHIYYDGILKLINLMIKLLSVGAFALFLNWIFTLNSLCSTINNHLKESKFQILISALMPIYNLFSFTKIIWNSFVLLYASTQKRKNYIDLSIFISTAFIGLLIMAYTAINLLLAKQDEPQIASTILSLNIYANLIISLFLFLLILIVSKAYRLIKKIFNMSVKVHGFAKQK